MTDAVHDALRTLRGDDAVAGTFFVPGRIEVLGKHTDYAGGRSLLAALDRGIVIAAAPRGDEAVRILNADTGELLETDSAGERQRTAGGVSHQAPGWATYPLTVLRRSALNFPAASRGGADMVFASDLPQAAGLSSSSALVVATFLALDAVRGFARTGAYEASIRDAADLAGYLGAVENGLSYGPLAGHAGVGTMGGSEDHTAILCARAGRLVQYSYAPVRFEQDVAVPDGWTFVIGSSGVRAEKSGAQLERYNQLAAAPRRLVQLWQQGTGSSKTDITLAGLLDSDPDAMFRLREIVLGRAPDEAGRLLARLAQFTAESEEIVPGACAALLRGDMRGFGDLVRRSQYYAEEVLRNQIPETRFLVASAYDNGAAAASAFGAGFGGSVWAFVREDQAANFLMAWRTTYLDRFVGHRDASAFFITPASTPAARLTGDAP